MKKIFNDLFSGFKTNVFCFMLAVFGPLIGYIGDEIFVIQKDFHTDLLGPTITIAWTGFWVILGIFQQSKIKDNL